MFCPSAVVGGIFIKTAMTCSETGGMVVGAEGVINVGWCQGAWQASGADGEPDGLSGDTRPLGDVDMVWGGS